jgi:hypothetical protein
MKIWVDFYKPRGKWYTGGVVDLGDVKPYQGRDLMLEAVWKNQDLLKASTDRTYWTVVSDDLRSLARDPEYKDFAKAVLQIGVNGDE